MNKVAYHEYLKSPEWQSVRQKKLAATGFCCDGCGAKTGLEIHHLTYSRVGRERMDDLMTLCRSCHGISHKLWRLPPTGFEVPVLRAMMRHFLVYCRELNNPRRTTSNHRQKANHGLNTLPQKAKVFLAESKAKMG
jgi:hypothetical protein